MYTLAVRSTELAFNSKENKPRIKMRGGAEALSSLLKTENVTIFAQFRFSISPTAKKRDITMPPNAIGGIYDGYIVCLCT